MPARPERGEQTDDCGARGVLHMVIQRERHAFAVNLVRRFTPIVVGRTGHRFNNLAEASTRGSCFRSMCTIRTSGCQRPPFISSERLGRPNPSAHELVCPLQLVPRARGMAALCGPSASHAQVGFGSSVSSRHACMHGHAQILSRTALSARAISLFQRVFVTLRLVSGRSGPPGLFIKP
jgi:hypothetical protein